MKHGDCGTCHWYERQQQGNGGFCFESPPRVLLVPVVTQPSSRVATPGAPQGGQGFALQAVYPTVLPDQRCSRYRTAGGVLN